MAVAVYILQLPCAYLTLFIKYSPQLKATVGEITFEPIQFSPPATLMDDL